MIGTSFNMKTIPCFSILIALLISSCASPNIGKEIKYNQAFCKKTFGECSGMVGDLLITYSIYKEGDGYKVKGEATYPKGKTMTWESYSSAMFTLYLIKNSTGLCTSLPRIQHVVVCVNGAEDRESRC
jgi:hypothetical protein